jgi:hypothetical protein
MSIGFTEDFITWALLPFKPLEEVYQTLTLPLISMIRNNDVLAAKSYLNIYNVEHGFPELPSDLTVQAAYSDSPKTMEFVISLPGTDINSSKQNTPPLLVSAALGNMNTMKYLIHNGALFRLAKQCWSPKRWSSIQEESSGRYLNRKSNDLIHFWQGIFSGQLPEHMPISADISSLFTHIYIKGDIELPQLQDITNTNFVPMLSKTVVLLGSRYTSKGHDTLRVEATTCEKYVQQVWDTSAWDALQSFLARIANFSLDYRSGVCRISKITLGIGDEGRVAYTASDSLGKSLVSKSESIRVNLAPGLVSDSDFYGCSITDDGKFQNHWPQLPIHTLVNLLTWACNALQKPPSDKGLFFSTPKFSVRQYNGTLQLTVTYDVSKLEEIKFDCWTKLFAAGVVVPAVPMAPEPHVHYIGNAKNVVEKAPQPPVEVVGFGLNVSLSILLQMASIEFPTWIEDFGYIFVGYRTALIPSTTTEEYIQFHLEVSEDGQIDPFKLNYSGKSPFQTLDEVPESSDRMCYVGWCSDALVHLGSQALAKCIPTFSGARERSRSLRLKGWTIGIQAASSIPAQIGVVAQANFGFRNNTLHFTPTDNYTQFLRNTSSETVIIYDTSSKRSWVISKLDLLIHMCHIWIKDNDISDHDVPFIEPHSQIKMVVERLQGQGDKKVDGNGSEMLSLRSFLMGMNVNLLNSIKVIEKAKKGQLYGFELWDIIQEPGRGSSIKELKLTSSSEAWSRLIPYVDAVVVCDGIGEIIKPKPCDSRKSNICNTLPQQQDFLAITISCMRTLLKRNGKRMPSALAGDVEFCENWHWIVSEIPFPICRHLDDPKHSCWDSRKVLQSIESGPVILRIMNQLNGTRESRNSNRGSPADTGTAHSSISEDGALVFGKLP